MLDSDTRPDDKKRGRYIRKKKVVLALESYQQEIVSKI